MTFDHNISSGAHEEYTFFNSEEKTLIYKVDIDMEENSISTIVSPKIFVLNPGESKSVKIFLKPKTVLKNGTYNGSINIESFPLILEDSNNVKLNVKLNISASI
ncbi:MULTISPECIES: hypothetical protein [unclassified Cetobacterium]|uniref:hypothetical protein n=1 Tax=unclassified Cetobacterium TaxID=2630983 RepID=UPI00064601E5|nr:MULTISPECIES: hypothetical protein [unclassified Cetobacterium]